MTTLSKGDIALSNAINQEMDRDPLFLEKCEFHEMMEMLKVLYVYEVAKSPSDREFEIDRIQGVIENLEQRLKS